MTDDFDRLRRLRLADFSAQVGTIFALRCEPFDLSLELVEAKDLDVPTRPATARPPFSLTLRGPLDPLLPQRTWELEHAELGRLPLFLVPLGPDGAGMRYEAVFS